MPARHPSSTVGGAIEGDSLKTEEKTGAVAMPARERDRIPIDLEWPFRQPTSAPTGVSRTRMERMSIIEWRSTP